MSTPSIRNQVNHALSLLVLDKEQIDAYKVEHSVASVKKDLRPNGNPTTQLPVHDDFLPAWNYRAIPCQTVV